MATAGTKSKCKLHSPWSDPNGLCCFVFCSHPLPRGEVRSLSLRRPGRSGSRRAITRIVEEGLITPSMVRSQSTTATTPTTASTSSSNLRLLEQTQTSTSPQPFVSGDTTGEREK